MAHIKTILLRSSFILLLFTSCDWMKTKTKETINKGGETVGKSASEFIEGVSEGVEKTLECEIVLSQNLRENGVKTGKFSIESTRGFEQHNRLVLYLIFEKAFKGSIMAKATDKQGLETGRAKVEVDAAAGAAGYYDFNFDSRTDIEVKSKITLE